MNVRTVLTIVAFLACSVHNHAAPPPGIITHQGRLAENGVNLDGPGSFKFALVGPTDPPRILWTPSGANIGQVTNAEPPAVIPLTLHKGLYAIPLGDPTFTPNMINSIPPTVFTDHQDVRLRVWFSPTGQAGSFERLSPDQRLTSTGYALSAASAGRVPEEAITTVMLAAGSITADKIAPGAVNQLDSPDGTLPGLVRTANDGSVVIGESGTPVDQVLLPAGATAPGSANDIAVQGRFAYVVTDTDLRIYDLADPENPTLRSLLAVPGGPLRAVAVDGDLACTVGGASLTLSVFKVSDPDSIAPLGSGPAGSGLGADVELRLSGPLACLTTYDSFGTGEFVVIDLSDPTTPTLRASLPEVDSPVLEVQGTFAYAIDFPTGVFPNGDKVLQIIDLSNPSAPSLRGTTIVNSQSTGDLVVAGPTLFMTGSPSEGLQSYDVSDPDTIVLLDSDNSGLANPSQLTVSGSLAFLHNDSNSTVRAFDVTDPSNLVPLPSIATVPPGTSGLGAGGLVVALAHQGSATPLLSSVLVRPARALVDGPLQVEGPLLDSSGANGFPGQILSSNNNGTSWIDLLDNDPANELQTLSLAGSSLQLSDGGNVPLGTLAAAFPAGSLPGGKITNGSIGTAQIEDGGVTASELAAGSVSTAALQNDAVTNAKIAAGAVDATALANDAVTNVKIAAGAVDTTALANDAVTSSKIDADAVTGFHIASGSILSSDILNGTITGDDLANGTITGAKIQNSTITGVKIENGSITRSDIAASTLTGAEILNNSISGADIQDGTLTGADIATGSITGADLTSATLSLNGDLEVGAASASDDDSIIFDGSSSLRWDNAEIRFIFSAGLAVNGPLTAGFGAIGDDAPYHFFSDVVPSPDSGDMTNTGDVYIRNDLEVDGTIYADGGLNQGSDRNRKENISPVDPAQTLEKIARLPISQWNYIDDDSKRPHIGPMAQDFHAAFRLGEDDKRISSIDTDGVALAAIQGLNAKVETGNQALRAENAALSARLEKLEAAVRALSKLDSSSP